MKFSFRGKNGKLKYFFIRECRICGESKPVRSGLNMPPERCSRCANSAKRGVPVPQRRAGTEAHCFQCGTKYYRQKSAAGRRFCSQRCANLNKRVYKKMVVKCKQCSRDFEYTTKPHSNNSGNFCTVECRNISYVGKYQGKPAKYNPAHRPGWASISRRFRKENDFCNCCGKRDGRLVVHHYDSYWSTFNNSQSNLVTLCQKHHSQMERLNQKTQGSESREKILAVVKAMLEERWHLIQGTRLLNSVQSNTPLSS